MFLWIVIIVLGVYYKSTLFNSYSATMFSVPALGFIIYFILSCLRGFTLIPATYFVLGGLVFFPPRSLFVVSLIAVLISSLLIYYFADSFRFYKYFEKRYFEQAAKIKSRFEQAEVPVVIGWILFPVVPADLVCYVCGILKADKKKMLIGVFVGEGIYFALLIFAGSQIIKVFYGK
ncbi:MAG: VTT domain-containing protein [Patescibacteria group bacterium]